MSLVTTVETSSMYNSSTNGSSTVVIVVVVVMENIDISRVTMVVVMLVAELVIEFLMY